MARVPETTSLEWLLGETAEDEHEAPALHHLSSNDLDRFIRQCSLALKSHAGDFERGYDKVNSLAAFEGVMNLLLEVREIYPEKRAEIDPVLVRFGYPVPEN